VLLDPPSAHEANVAKRFDDEVKYFAPANVPTPGSVALF
jgi:hypothetical protein